MIYFRLFYFFTIMLTAMVLSGCSSDESDAERGREMIEMPVTIAIPAEGFANPNDVATGEGTASQTRGVGDPGTAETFSLPQYLYIYIVSKDNESNTQVIYTKQTVNQSEWILSTSDDNHMDAAHFSAKDGVYVYQGHISVSLPMKRTEGRVYVIASNVELDDSKGDNKISLVTSATWTSESKFVNAITFNNDGQVRSNLQNIYSSPYNKTVDGKYYGIIQDYTSNAPHIDMVLYHVATKIDLMWTIDEPYQGTAQWPQPATPRKKHSSTDDDMRSTTDTGNENYNKIFFSYIEARKLPKKGLKPFDPMGMSGNTYSESTFDLAFHGKEVDTGKESAPTGTIYYQVMPESDKASMYYGRKVIYAMPLRYDRSGDYFITLRILVNNYTTSSMAEDAEGNKTYTSLLTGQNHATTGYHTYIRISDDDMKDKDTNGKPIYTPWIRATLHVKSATDVGNIVKFNDPTDYKSLL